MIISDKISINKHPHYHKLLEEVFGSPLLCEIYEIDIKYLSKNSHKKINVKCDYCGKEKELSYSKYNKNTKIQTRKYACCSKCATIKSKETKLINYGDENYNNSKKSKETKLINYGDENYNNRKKFNLTLHEKYGGHYNKILFYKNKIKETKLSKYDNENYNNQEQSKETCLLKYGVKHSFQSKNNIKKSKETKIKKLEKKYNINILEKNKSDVKCLCTKHNHTYEIYLHLIYDRYNSNVELCTICNPIGHHISNKEKQLLEFIKENYDGKIITSDRKILNGLELDIYLPEIGLAFEFNGDYWHNTDNKPKDYHLNKTTLSKLKNIELIHIFEYEWDNNQDIIKKIISSKLNNYSYSNIKYLFEINNMIFENKCFNLNSDKSLQFIKETGSYIKKINKHNIEFPGYNIYNKNNKK